MIRAITILCLGSVISFGQYSPPAGQIGSTAIHKDSSAIIGWANHYISFDPGPQDISVGAPLANFGVPGDATNYAEGNSFDIVSLGDGGEIVLGFNYPIQNGTGPDFAVFENGFDDLFLEFAHVEVSTDGITFVRFPSISLVPITVQTGSFASTDTKLIHNLAGKFRQGYGTPFDLEDLIDSTAINVDSINYVKIIDVVGSVSPLYGSYDQFGTIINDPYPTAFESGGFDLDGVAVLNANGTFLVGIEEQPSVNIFPNPTSDFIVVEGEQVDKLDLYRMNGQLIHSTLESKIGLKELDLKSGVYILKVETITSSITQKVTFVSE